MDYKFILEYININNGGTFSLLTGEAIKNEAIWLFPENPDKTLILDRGELNEKVIEDFIKLSKETNHQEDSTNKYFGVWFSKKHAYLDINESANSLDDSLRIIHRKNKTFNRRIEGVYSLLERMTYLVE